MPLLALTTHAPTLIRNGNVFTVLDRYEAEGRAATAAPVELYTASGSLPDDAVLVADAPKAADAALLGSTIALHPQLIAVIRAADALERALVVNGKSADLRRALTAALVPFRSAG